MHEMLSEVSQKQWGGEAWSLPGRGGCVCSWVTYGVCKRLAGERRGVRRVKVLRCYPYWIHFFISETTHTKVTTSTAVQLYVCARGGVVGGEASRRLKLRK